MPAHTKSDVPHFVFRTLDGGAYAIDDRGRTVATITQRGYVDWLLISPLQSGELIEGLSKETHMSYVRGFKFNLTCPYVGSPTRRMGTDPVSLEHRIEDNGAQLVLVCRGLRPDGAIASLTTARLTATDDGGRYEWSLTTTVRNVSKDTQVLAEMEYNNVLPALAYRGILHGRKKEFDCTLLEDAQGVVWEFPHQHSMHYGKKMETIVCGTTSWSGFFGSENSCPIVEVTHSDVPLSWGICDMYYDLHCTARTPLDFAPEQEIRFDYVFRYLSPTEAKDRLGNTQKIAVSADDIKKHDYPRLDFGLNSFARPVHIDLPDEACCYRPAPPHKVWDRETGGQGKGSLRLASEGETVVWSSEPPVHVINGTTLRIGAKVRARDVKGVGFYFRLRYYTYCWDPTPGFQPIKSVCSEPVTGTTADWVVVALPELEIPPGPVEDGLVRLDLVLEGTGTAWATDIDIEMDESLLSTDQEHVVKVPAMA